MTLFITSSPFLENTPGPVFNGDNRFITNLKRELPQNPRGLFVASYPELHDWTCSLRDDVAAACGREGIFFSRFDVLDSTTAHLAEELVPDSDFIVFAGGHLPTQNSFLMGIGLDIILRNFDGVLMGISAGSMNMAKTVYATPEEAGESGEDFARFIPGLGLTDIQVLPHYQKAKDMFVDGLHLYTQIVYPDSTGNCFYAIPDGSYILQKGAVRTIFGESWIVKNAEQTQLTYNGESLEIEQP